MNKSELIGLVAGAFTTISFVPQVVKTWKTKSAKGLSLGMFSLFCVGLILWLIYGILIDALPVIITNSVTIVLALTLIYFKFKFKD
ncbi:MAG: SemiSWEET transporter [Bacteroidota bacterium]